VPRHVARLVTRLVVDYFASCRLVVDYFAYAARPGASACCAARLIVDYSVRRDFVLRPHCLYFSHVVRRDYLSHDNTSSTSTIPRAAVMLSFGRLASTIHLN
jgi:hypothetical protein